MELEGHPTQDIIEELQKRGCIVYDGSAAGPDRGALKMVALAGDESAGFWIFLPAAAFDTEIDEDPLRPEVQGPEIKEFEDD